MEDGVTGILEPLEDATLLQGLGVIPGGFLLMHWVKLIIVTVFFNLIKGDTLVFFHSFTFCARYASLSDRSLFFSKK